MSLQKMKLGSLTLILIGMACDPPITDPPIVDPPIIKWSFAANFDSASVFRDLFPNDLSAWTNFQCVQPSGTTNAPPPSSVALFVAAGGNSLGLDSTHVVSGAQAIKFVAPISGPEVSKASIAKEEIDIRPGDTLVSRFRLYLASSSSADNVFLFDLESTQYGGYPGRRLMIDSGGYLLLESKGGVGSIPYNAGQSFSQPNASKIALPTDQWVNIKVEFTLARDGSGKTRLWQNGVLLIDATGRNFPVESAITHYNWVEFGLTANSSANTQTLWIDDISMNKNY